MKALVIHGAKDVRIDTVEDPRIQQPTDVLLRVTSTAICGSDLHLYNGAIPQPRPMVLGHEFMGIVEEVGAGVSRLKKGDRVVIPFPIACGHCWFCQHDNHDHCENSNPDFYGPEGDLMKQKGGALFGYSDLYGGYDGGQAEFVRVPYADVGPRHVPENLTDEEILFTTDIFPTGYSGVKWAQPKGGETIAIFGSGPVGLMAAKSAWLLGAGRVIIVDPLQYRLDKARTTARAETILFENVEDTVEQIRQMTQGRGADICIEAVGFEPERDLLDRAKAVINFEKGSMKVLQMCYSAVRRGGFVSVLGVYSSPYDNYPVHQLFDKGITVRMGQSSEHELIDECIAHVAEGRVKLDDIITHRFPLDRAPEAYDIFRNKKDDCTKVVLKPGL